MPAQQHAQSPPVKHVFVDYENMHELDLNLLSNKSLHRTLLLGPSQKKLDLTMVEQLLEHASAIQIVHLTSAAKNAVDFALAYYLGRAAAADPTAHFLIVSKDKGYDPLIEHLPSKHVNVLRQKDLGNRPAVSASNLVQGNTPAVTTNSGSPHVPPLQANGAENRVSSRKPSQSGHYPPRHQQETGELDSHPSW